MAVTDQDLLTGVQYRLLEPPDGGLTWPSGLWSQSEILAYANERQNRLLKASLLQIGISDDILLAAGVFRFALPDDWIATASVVWTGSDGTIVELIRSDAFDADHGIPDWGNRRGTPQVYMDYETPTLQLQIAPAPLLSGTIQLLYVARGDTLDGTGAVLLTVPDEWAPVLEYGVLAEAWSKDGRGKNPEKAAYCESRFQLGIDAARIILEGFV